jgi:hypothetical protein
MVGSIAAVDFAFSAITLALFADSGFYKVVYDHATSFSWGRNKGCSFHTTPCLINGVSQFSEFCNVQQEGCDANNLNVGICTISTTLTLPVYNQYFSNPSQGGPDSLADYCPIYLAYSNAKCKVSTVTRIYRTVYKAVGETGRQLHTLLPVVMKLIALEGKPLFTSTIRPQ